MKKQAKITDQVQQSESVLISDNLIVNRKI